jgi:pimeloyl-ACP methyl ester carboxylesterase
MNLPSALDDLRPDVRYAPIVRSKTPGSPPSEDACESAFRSSSHVVWLWRRRQVRKTSVDIKASDGVVLKATYYSPGSPGPAVLVHQCNMDRRAWDAFADALAHSRFHVLAPDLHGFGESGRNQRRRSGAAISPQRSAFFWINQV